MWCAYLVVLRLRQTSNFLNEIEGNFGIKPDKAIYNAAIKSCSRKNKWNIDDDEDETLDYEYALQFYAKIIENGFEPDSVTFANLLHVLVKAKESDLALEVWSEMTTCK